MAMISLKSRTYIFNMFFKKNFSDFKSVENRNKSETKSKRKEIILENKSFSAIDGQSSQQYCIQCVKKYDFDNYLSTLLLKPSSVRRQAFAIRAFNAEISQIRDLTLNKTLAQIRLQYWSDLIDEIFANNSMVMDTNQPIAYELQRCERNAKLAKHWFKKLIQSRIDGKNLSDFPFKTFEELEKYCDSSVTPVYNLIVQCSTSGSKVSASKLIDLDHMGHHLGRAQGIANVLRGVVHNAAHHRCYIPSDLLVKHKTSHEDFLRATHTSNVFDLCFEMATKANQNIETVKSLLKKVDRQNRLVFLSLVPIQDYLNRLQKLNFNIFDSKLRQRNGFLPFILWYKSKVI